MCDELKMLSSEVIRSLSQFLLTPQYSDSKTERTFLTKKLQREDLCPISPVNRQQRSVTSMPPPADFYEVFRSGGKQKPLSHARKT